LPRACAAQAICCSLLHSGIIGRGSHVVTMGAVMRPQGYGGMSAA